ncbi:MAG: restriction endonuclease [Pseudomonadota bacterium]
MTAWMVRAGPGGANFQTFQEDGYVALGWRGLGPPQTLTTREMVSERMQHAYPSLTTQGIATATGTVHRFLNEVVVGDRVITYDKGSRVYLCGTIAGAVTDHPEEEDEALMIRRAVRWSHETSRDDLDQAARSALGSILTLFRIAPHAEAQLWTAEGPPETAPAAAASLDTAPIDLEGQAVETVKDHILGLDWQQMEGLVAALLRAMGYRTRVSPKGADRGRDVVASPDGLGLTEPRIFVEVKHRRGRIGAPDIRSFLGGRRPGDRGLYVSTGGFTQEARYEADRATTPTVLLDI